MLYSWQRGLQPRLINWSRNTSKLLFSSIFILWLSQNEQCSDTAIQVYTVNPPSQHPSCSQRKTNPITEQKIFSSCRICPEHGSRARPKGVVGLRPGPGLCTETPTSQPVCQFFRVADPHELLALSFQRYRHHKSFLCSTPGLSTLSIAALHTEPCLLPCYF